MLIVWGENVETIGYIIQHYIFWTLEFSQEIFNVLFLSLNNTVSEYIYKTFCNIDINDILIRSYVVTTNNILIGSDFSTHIYILYLEIYITGF